MSKVTSRVMPMTPVPAVMPGRGTLDSVLCQPCSWSIRARMATAWAAAKLGTLVPSARRTVTSGHSSMSAREVKPEA